MRSNVLNRPAEIAFNYSIWAKFMIPTWHQETGVLGSNLLCDLE